jgi:hypothetical protein
MGTEWCGVLLNGGNIDGQKKAKRDREDEETSEH